jgi:hypothetical protein
LSSDSGASTGLSEVRWTRTTVGGPNNLGGSITGVVGGEIFGRWRSDPVLVLYNGIPDSVCLTVTV